MNRLYSSVVRRVEIASFFFFSSLISKQIIANGLHIVNACAKVFSMARHHYIHSAEPVTERITLAACGPEVPR
jgi:hypothetical protein